MLYGRIKLLFFQHTFNHNGEIGTEVIYTEFRSVVQFSERVCLHDDGYSQCL